MECTNLYITMYGCQAPFLQIFWGRMASRNLRSQTELQAVPDSWKGLFSALYACRYVSHVTCHLLSTETCFYPCHAKCPVARLGRVMQCRILSLYVCMYVRTYVRTLLRTYVCTYVPTYVCMHVCVYVCTYAWMDGWMYVCMHVCMYASMDACIHASMHPWIHACTYVWSMCGSMYGSIRMHLCMGAWMHGCMDACIYASIYLSIHPSIYLPIFCYVELHLCFKPTKYHTVSLNVISFTKVSHYRLRKNRCLFP